MCGISGIYNVNCKPVDVNLLNKMTKIISHRGPDDEGFLLVNTSNNQISHQHDDDTIDSVKSKTEVLNNNLGANLGIGFRRLSIIDLSEAGHQPMSNDEGNLWITFNGEVYNYVELREELKQYGYQFKSSSDTEVILKSYEHWGKNCLNKFNGMWAFAIWDSKNQRLFCARDRFGIKPFNYFWDGKTLIWGSEIKQILESNVDKSLDYGHLMNSMGLNSFLYYKDHTYFEKIKVLEHSHYLVIENGELQINRYYDLDANTFEVSNLTYNDAIEEYRFIFKDAVRLRMRADVNVGTCLSGGLDSSAITCIASEFTNEQLHTFSAIYPHGGRYNEKKWMEIVNEKLNSKAHYITPTAHQYLNLFEELVENIEYPISSSMLSQYCLMREAKSNNVKVIIDGQGSDEILTGYNHAYYRYFADIYKKNPINFIRDFTKYLKNNSLNKLPKIFASTIFSESTLYNLEKNRLLNSFNFHDKRLKISFSKQKEISKLSEFQYNLLMNTSIQTLLHYEDRNSMKNSVETRVPFLDYRLVEFAFSLPNSYKINGEKSKIIHRDALGGLVPQEILTRKDKVNFATPGEEFWLRNEMKDYITSIFNSTSFKNRDIFNYDKISKIFSDYMNGDNSKTFFITRLMCLEVWMRKYID
jgi:asparagine synthase (glutamine-hydrolysing)